MALSCLPFSTKCTSVESNFVIYRLNMSDEDRDVDVESDVCVYTSDLIVFLLK